MKCAVSEKGQVTIPKRIRDQLGLKPGSVLEFEARKGLLVGRKATPAGDPVGIVTGIVALDQTVDEYLEGLRGEAE